MSLTLVSFYIGIKGVEGDKHGHHKLDDYIHSGQLLIDIPIKKILFIDEEIVGRFRSNPNTHIIPITLADFDLYVKYYKDCVEGKIKVLSPNAAKDTALFHLLQLSKTIFMRRAIEMNYFATDIFAWIDFGIRKIYKSDEEMISCLYNINTKEHIDCIPRDTLLMPGCWPVNANDFGEFNHIMWYCCGGFFIGYKEEVLKFANHVNADTIYILEVEKKLTFEVNVWFRLLRIIAQNMDFVIPSKKIKIYYADHNATLTRYWN